MKYTAAVLGLTVWGILTLLLACSLIGLIVIVDEDTYWSSIPKSLLKVFDDPNS